MPRIEPGSIRLRPVIRCDLPALFEMQADPESNALAVTVPRSAAAFEAHWNHVLTQSGVIALAILREGSLVGTISCFPAEDRTDVGYWIRRDCWGQGIASTALALLLKEVPARPLSARIATKNRASLRVLVNCGFQIRKVYWYPGDDRFPACEEALLELRADPASLPSSNREN
jgi:RimJ/RimL family protein N-acetyltransferase